MIFFHAFRRSDHFSKSIFITAMAIKMATFSYSPPHYNNGTGYKGEEWRRQTGLD
jgi:hypothetical protein